MPFGVTWKVKMKSNPKPRAKVAMRREYDFSGGVVGKYAKRYREGSNVVLLDPDIADAFADSKSVNDALRTLIEIAESLKTRR
jgi:hypothetical protein